MISHKFLCEHVLSVLLTKCLGDRRAESWSRHMFGFIKNARNLSKRGCSISHLHQSCRKVLVSPHTPSPALSLSVLGLLNFSYSGGFYFIFP